MATIKLRFVNAFANRDRKNVRLRYYFRRRGSKTIPLPGVPGSEEFMAAYAAALAGLPETAIEIGAARTLPGTINALCVAYYASDAWSRLATETQRARRVIIERFRERHGTKCVASLRQDHIVRMLGEIGRPSTKRLWLKTVRGLLQAAVPSMRKDDPTIGIAPIKLRKSRGHHTWTNDEIEQYRAHWPLGTQQRLALELALETVSRRGEITRLGPQHVRDGHIHIERTHGSADVDILMSAELQAACDAMPKARI